MYIKRKTSFPLSNKNLDRFNDNLSTRDIHENYDCHSTTNDITDKGQLHIKVKSIFISFIIIYISIESRRKTHWQIIQIILIKKIKL